MTVRRILLVSACTVVVGLTVLAVSGFALFSNARSDPLRKVDAVVVLGGEHDGREQYGLQLAREGFAPVVLLSDPYPSRDPVMRRMCASTVPGVDVLCRSPTPATTRGEAIMTRQLAAERNWTSIIVVSWRYHLPRAQLIFDQCFSDRPGAVVVRAVPRAYQFSLLQWAFVYSYQYAGFAKAFGQGDCV